MSVGDALDLGRATWDGLKPGGPGSSPFLSWAWHRAWSEAVPPGESSAVRVLVLRSTAGEPVALFPCRLRRARLRRVPVVALEWAIDDLGCPDHLDLLAWADANLEPLVRELARFAWDVILLRNVAEQAPNLGRFAAACQRLGWAVRWRSLWSCPYLDLPDTWEGYLATLSPNRRQVLGRKERKLGREHTVEVVDYRGATFPEGWDVLRWLHQLRWGGPGAFGALGFDRLHRRFAELLGETGRVWLTSLNVDGAPAAAWYGFGNGDTMCYYQGGWHPQWEHASVGTVLMAKMIRRAIDHRLRRFDFLRGDEPYKASWTQAARPCYEVTVFRNGWRGWGLRWLDWVARHRRAP